MQARTKFFLVGSVLLVFFSCSVRRSYAQTNVSKDSKGDSAKIYSELTVVTNYVSKGLTQTEKDPAFQAGFGYRLNAARFGLWGSNVKYEGSDEHLNLRGLIGYNFLFTQNVQMFFHYDYSKFYKSGTRNGTILSFDLNIFDYHILLDREDNFEGLNTSRSWYGFKKQWAIPWSLFLEGTIGYSMISSGYDNFFDSRIEIKYKTNDLTYALGNTFNSGASQFNGRGDATIYLAMSGKW